MVIGRERLGLTQSALAGNARVSRATLALIEAGNADPRLSTIVAIATALRSSAAELLDAREDASP